MCEILGKPDDIHITNFSGFVVMRMTREREAGDWVCGEQKGKKKGLVQQGIF